MGAEKTKMLAGELYDASDPELVDERRACRLQLEWFNASTAEDAERRKAAFAAIGVSVGEGTIVEPPFYCDYGYNITIGAHCQFNFGVTILDCAPVTIGDGVLLGPHVQLLAAEHPVEPDLRRAGYESSRPITIGDGAWLGAGAIVNPGVTIGADSVVGSGSVVIADVPPLVVVAGNPARVLRQL